MENLLKQIEELREKILDNKKNLGIERKRVEAKELEAQAAEKDFWQDQRKAIQVKKKLELLQEEVQTWDNLVSQIRALEEMAALSEKENDFSLQEEIKKKFQETKEKFQELDFCFLFSGSYDRYDAILSIHAGTGGTDAQDWAAMLERMYLRFCQRKNWRVIIADRIKGQEAGIKSVTFHIKGSYAYGFLKSENGTHRLVRISPFDAEKMRHTSFALVEVLPDLPEPTVKLEEKDLRIDVFRSSGHGGQSVNTTDSAVRLVHLPTGLTVVCRNERSQKQNKEMALKILQARLQRLEEEKEKKKEKELKGEQQGKWSEQIRSYVLHPYQLVKDHRTRYEEKDVSKVLDGYIDNFIESYLREKNKCFSENITNL